MTIACSVHTTAEAPVWTSCPINPAWILDGNPIARAEHLSGSADGTANTYLWDCTAGRFNWHYAFDETLHILEGSVLLKFVDGTSRRVGAGDIVFFPAGATAEWTVERYIRKLAFCRTPLPAPLVSLRSLVRSFKRLRPGGAKTVPGMFPAS
jgi:hypothetical protein